MCYLVHGSPMPDEYGGGADIFNDKKVAIDTNNKLGKAMKWMMTKACNLT